MPNPTDFVHDVESKTTLQDLLNYVIAMAEQGHDVDLVAIIKRIRVIESWKA